MRTIKAIVCSLIVLNTRMTETNLALTRERDPSAR